MKKIFISAGLVAVSAAGLQSALADDAITPASPKVWSVSATLRGFYDDNYSTANNKKGSAGVELSPSASVNLSLPQTDLGLRYTYGAYWYSERQDLGQNAIDQTHQLDFWLDHAFNERWKVNVTDTFSSGQEPELINGSGPEAVPFRVNGNNIGNHFNIDLDTQWSRQFSTSLYYGNDFYDYQNTGYVVNPGTTPYSPPFFGSPQSVNSSLAGLLNQVDQNVGLDLQWHLQLETMLFVGYEFTWYDYTGNQPIGVVSPVPESGLYHSRDRDLTVNQIHAGIQHQFTANLGGKASVGAQYADNYNQDTTSWSPYANISLNYTYLPGSYVELGFSQGINSTYVAQVTTGAPLTQYQESSTIYGSVNHRFTEKLLGSVIGQYVYSDFHGGGDLGADQQFSVGLNLSYQFNRFISADIGYNYDNLQSDVPGATYDRNRYYIGLTATY